MDNLAWTAPIVVLQPSRLLRQGIAVGLGLVLLLGVILSSLVGSLWDWGYALPAMGLVGMVGLAGLVAALLQLRNLVGQGFLFGITLGEGKATLSPIDRRVHQQPWLAPLALGFFSENPRWILGALQRQTNPQQLHRSWEQVGRIVLDSEKNTLTLIPFQGEAWVIPCPPEVFPQVVQYTTQLLGHWQTMPLAENWQSTNQTIPS